MKFLFFLFLFLPTLDQAYALEAMPYGYAHPEEFAGDEGSAVNGHTFIKIDTCYHWLTAEQLSSKVEWARKNKGELYFYGDYVIYCWRSPLGAYSAWEDHGDELIRIKFIPGIEKKTINRERIDKFAGVYSKGAKVIYSNNESWHEYTITPEAVESWSMYQPYMIAEMEAELAYYDAGKVTADDVFYHLGNFDIKYLHRRLDPIIESYKDKSKTMAEVFGKNPENHFQSSVDLPWKKHLNSTDMKIRHRAKIFVLEASYGMNLGLENKNNALDAARNFCDNKAFCNYKVSAKYLTDPAPGKDKSFAITWRCGERSRPQILEVPAPAEGKVLNLECGFADDTDN